MGGSDDGSSSDAELSLSEEREVMNGTKTVTTGGSILSGMVNYLQQGGSIMRIFQSGILGLFIAPVLTLTDVIAAIGSFFATPFREGGIAIGELFNAFLTSPANLIETGVIVSRDALRTYFGDNFLGIFGLPVAFGVVLLALFLYTLYLSQRETGDTIAGLPFDVPDVFGLQFGVEEEGEDQADE